MALQFSGATVALREVVLRSKPDEMLSASPKGTVPVLVLPDGQVIDESLDIMYWALEQNDPADLLNSTNPCDRVIALCDSEFKGWLDRYKYADRHPERSQQEYRAEAERFLATLEDALSVSEWLGDKAPALTDVAVFPFIRQFAGVDPTWWEQAPYPAVRSWLERWLATPQFAAVMKKYPVWEAAADATYFPE